MNNPPTPPGDLLLTLDQFAKRCFLPKIKQMAREIRRKKKKK